MTTGGYILGSAVGGLIAGAIGGYVADSSRSHPILKASLAVGAVNALIAAVGAASYESAKIESAGTVHGLGEPTWP